MKDDLLKEIEKIFEIAQDSTYEFRHIYGFTFVFKTTMLSFKGEISSAEIKPVGIIYKENGQYYRAPLYEGVKIERIIEEFIREEEYLHFQQ